MTRFTSWFGSLLVSVLVGMLIAYGLEALGVPLWAIVVLGLAILIWGLRSL